MNVAGAPAELKRQENKEDDNWDYKEDRRVYEEKTTATELHLAVGKIADAIVGTVTAMASGGTLAPFLLKSLRGAVVNASWSASDKRDKLVKKEIGEKVMVFIEIDKFSQSSNKGLMGSTRSTLNVKADTKFLVATALNDAAIRKLQNMKRAQMADKLNYIKEAQLWSAKEEEKAKNGGKGGGKIDRDRTECTFCQRTELCHIM